MMRVLVAASQMDTRTALRLLLQTLEMQVVGESADWAATLQLAQELGPEIVLIDWEIIPPHTLNILKPLRHICRNASIIVLGDQLHLPQRAALVAEADLLLSKSEMPDQIANHILAVGRRQAALQNPIGRN